MTFALGNITALAALFGAVASLAVVALGAAVAVVAHDYRPTRVSPAAQRRPRIRHLAHSH